MTVLSGYLNSSWSKVTSCCPGFLWFTKTTLFSGILLSVIPCKEEWTSTVSQVTEKYHNEKIKGTVQVKDKRKCQYPDQCCHHQGNNQRSAVS